MSHIKLHSDSLASLKENETNGNHIVQVTNTANIKLEDLTSSLNADHVNNNKSIAVKQKATYESQTLSISGTFLTTAPAQNGTSIDMLNYRNLYIQIRMVGDTGLGSILNNIFVYYSLDNITFRLGEKIELEETDSASGNYEGIIRIKDTGARYVRLYAKNRVGNPSNYLVQFSRSN